MKRYNAKRKTHRNLKNIKKLIPTALVLLSFVSLLAGIITLHNPKTLPFRQIKITVSSDHIKMVELKDIVVHHIQGGFFSFNASTLQTALMSLPWVHNMSVRRIWPNELEIQVEEQRPIARWNQNELITQKGEIFSPPLATIPQNIPQLSGPNNSEENVLNQFQQFSQLLIPFHAVVTALSLTKRGAWSLILNGHAQIFLGDKNIDQRFKQFVHLYPKIIGENINRVEYVDLRYSNGLAIQWKN
ncbi:FtsQ-type POTRA domain-containing protein [Coxiella endosymbiont of Ornithodoros amblus]|uniref:cell division protein FtsQ/DivIB n=1 Tax=Coxiella endosymbiont of Ornithodoros amblus TaxID=1656166 RepID=UPI00244E2572|nr:cell division protein FtsQ/DivIB [Coxiella endosymbiont of Ornithodoros amblus]MBW5802359.1 FtsQ-type POTRA domain-containing protein [Coxiella endosymbiont of Ornithodoros amblus]